MSRTSPIRLHWALRTPLNRQRLANSYGWCRSPQVSSTKLANGRAGLIKIGKDLGHTSSSNEKELITSITSGAAFFGAISAGTTADKFGRKPAIYVGCVLFIIGAIFQAASFGLAQMTVGRLVVGFGVGSAAMIVPMYIAEVSPAKYRGRMIGLYNMSIAGGQLASYGVSAVFAHVCGRRCTFVPNE